MVAKDVSGKERVPATPGAKAATSRTSARKADAEGTTAEKGAAKTAGVGPRSGAEEEGTAGASAAKRTAGKKTAATKAGVKETAARKSEVKDTAAKRVAARKAAVKKTPARKGEVKESAAARKAAAKESAAQQSAAGKDAATEAVAEKGAAEKTAATKSSTSKKSTARNTSATSGAEKAGAAEAAETTGATTVVAKNTPGTATAAKKPTAVPKARPAAADPGELAVRPGEDPWSPEEVAEARTELTSEAMRLRAELDASEKSLTGLMRDSGDGAGDDQADTGAKNITREHEMALAHNAREMLDQTERALERLATGTYGLCESCGNPIGKARMQAFPRATLCVECKQKQERR
ncbi:TraR/DksA family transcriptional regulator [Streptomyces ossamyceticus]|nr:TraR/DksA family transcriptional regulator [Streptomyces ossamyceticus]